MQRDAGDRSNRSKNLRSRQRGALQDLEQSARTLVVLGINGDFDRKAEGVIGARARLRLLLRERLGSGRSTHAFCTRRRDVS
jgi:hypothetical protein